MSALAVISALRRSNPNKQGQQIMAEELLKVDLSR
jgi:hypothetical protein